MNLAALLAAGERNLREVERQVETMLSRIWPATPTSSGWRGWKYTSPDGIDVFSVKDSPGAVARLHSAGFVTVTLHDHRAERFLSCQCEVHERTAPGTRPR